ncbi:rhodanese-like domain-containing protein [Nostoc ellipsosporum NOK]|jgi:phage shock protein E|nr:rhodanese-like domain-containing protein [Nostoc ellipsosporum NOK]
MGLFSFLNKGPIKAALREGAVIIDIRSAQEYDQGRIPGSLNIPVDRLSGHIQRLKGFEKPLIICGTDSTRIKQAIRKLKSEGFADLYDGGDWAKLFMLKSNLKI